VALGAIIAIQSYLQNRALSTGAVTYTITMKRAGVLFGILWGWLFFKETIIFRKILGIIIAIAGISIIIFSA